MWHEYSSIKTANLVKKKSAAIMEM